MGYDDCLEAITKIHNAYLKEFEGYLKAKNLSEKTIARHVDHADFFVNVYLLRYMDTTIYDGAASFNDFFGYFFIRKCLFSSIACMKEYIASL